MENKVDEVEIVLLVDGEPRSIVGLSVKADRIAVRMRPGRPRSSSSSCAADAALGWHTGAVPPAPGSALERLREAEEFFLKKAPPQSTLEKLARRLDQEGIHYAVVGGMALNLHGYVRVTRDVVVLMTRADLAAF